MAIILDGKIASKEIKLELLEEVELLVKKYNQRPPHLVAVLIGENPASKAYVSSKMKSCKEIGMDSTIIEKSDQVTEEEVLELIDHLNSNQEIDGYIIQLPLPKHINEHRILQAVAPDKDVDGFHPLNLGKMVLSLPTFLPATPYGILLLLKRFQIDVTGMHAVVIGRSHIVGTPMSILLSRDSQPGNCTVTITHSKTKNLKEITKSADLIIAALGKPQFLDSTYIKEGAVIVDVGINRITSNGVSKLVGDVHYEDVLSMVRAITPVPGGVGLMTVASLMKNTVQAYRQNFLHV